MTTSRAAGRGRADRSGRDVRTALGRAGRWAALGLASVAGALVAIAAGDALYSTGLPPLRPWHTVDLENEFVAAQADDTGYDFDAYRRQEARLFEEVAALAAQSFDPALDSPASRFGPGRGPYAARVEGDWNRSFVLPADRPRGVALLVHGLSDSPYSMRSTALALQRAGVTVYGLRLPGHGTLPGALDDAAWEDWLASVALAQRQIRRDLPGLPYWYVGYSTGATLGLKLVAQAVLEGRDDTLPARLFLLSPALGVSPFAPLANVQRLITRFGVVRKARWGNVGPELDPHKYESFAKNAGAQIAALIRSLYRDLDRLERDGAIGRLPAVTAFQSIVDATVSTPDLAGRFYGRLRGGGSELVLFDVNRSARLEALLSFSPREVIAAFERSPRREYRLTVIGNAEGSASVRERSWGPGATQPLERMLSLAWPDDVYSLSHVALPFAPDDPIYGLKEGPGPDGLPSLGALAFRGERGALAIAAGDQLRLRSNPFFDYVAQRMLDAIDGAGQSGHPPAGPARQ
jgi:alpha-beta hydrolase superfamily lysophospholipase